MTRIDEPGRKPDEREPSATLAWVFAAVAALCTGVAGLWLGPWAAVMAFATAALGFAGGRFAGVVAGHSLGRRARADLYSRLVATEAQLVRSQLAALRAPTGGDDKALLAEMERREAAERALEEERAQRTSITDQSQVSVDTERRQRQVLQEQAQRVIAEERRQRQALEEQAKNIIAEERRLRAAAQQETERAVVDERKRRQALEEQLIRVERAAQVESQALRNAAAVAQREAERLSSSQNGAIREVERVLAPYIEREKLLLELAKIGGPTKTRQDLPVILETIASKANFTSIVLSDETGLPVAASRGSRDPDGTAATSSLFFTLADRLVTLGHPAPISVLVHDEGNETSVHRIFRAGAGRFLITATGRGRGVVPETLDPTIDTIERALLLESWADEEASA